MRRRNILLVFFSAQSDYEKSTRGPRRKFVYQGNQFDDEGGKEQGMESQRESQKNHRHDIDGTVKEHQSQGAKQNLEAIRGERHAPCQPDAASREDRREQAIGHAADYHGLKAVKIRNIEWSAERDSGLV